MTMTRGDLDKQLETLGSIYENKKKELIRRYIDANNPVTIGDKVTGHSRTLIVNKISYSLWRDPCAIYYGVELKKDGTPCKKQQGIAVYQSNLVKHEKQ